MKESKWVADDGTVCGSEEEMKEFNDDIERQLMPDRISKVFGWWLGIERDIWFQRNMARRGLPYPNALLIS